MKRKHTPLGIASLPVVLGFGVTEPTVGNAPARDALRDRAEAQEKRAAELRAYFPIGRAS